MKRPTFNGFIRAGRLERGGVRRFDVYPFCIPAARHYRVTKDFLNRHERMRELLLSAEDDDMKSKAR